MWISLRSYPPYISKTTPDLRLHVDNTTLSLEHVYSRFPPQTIGKGEPEHSLSCAATSRKIPPLKGTNITKQRFYVNAILLQTVVSGHLP